MQSPASTTRAFLMLIVAAAIFLDFWAYSQQFYRDPSTYTDVLRGTASAPSQYRVGVIFVASFIAAHGHIGLRHAMTVLDAASATIAVYLLYGLLRRSAIYQAAGNEVRWFGSAAFVVLIQFHLLWLTWYQRPETLPTVALLSCTVWLLTPDAHRSQRPALLFIALVLIAVAQAFVRADVSIALNLGILFVCLSKSGTGSALTRVAITVVSLLSIAIGLGVQWTLIHIAYPQASYGTTPIFQLVMNFTSPLRIFPFALFMMPFAWTLRNVVRQGRIGGAPLLGVLAGGTIFLVIWCVMGKIDEVRIFLPFALALAPLTVQFAMMRASAES